MPKTRIDKTGNRTPAGGPEAGLYPLLARIDNPGDLRRLPQEKLEDLCREMRRFLINSLSNIPGHFASSMGAVELTVALHYVFDTPYDRIVWDVGHQSYGHKILTGRRKKFDTIRQFGGLSGFPSPDESEYDAFTSGHASNSISAALGIAVASKMKDDGRPRHVVAVIGDASISSGLAFEGLNNAANTPNNLLIVLNDNGMSIDHNVGSLNSYLAHITTSKSYNTFRYNTYRFLKRCHLVTERQKGFILRFNNSLKALLSRQQNIFEGLDIRYFGPFDGHDVNRIVRVLREIKEMEGPRILHLRTVKGKGYAPAENDPAAWHSPGKFDTETGERLVKEGGHKYQDVFGMTLVELAKQNEKVIGITAAMLQGTGLNHMQEAFPNRVFDVGISEGHAITFAGGLAKEGMRPFCAIYSAFLQRGYDNIIHDVAIQRLPVVLCIDRAGLVGEDGVTHHGVFDLSYLRSIPGMIVSSPRDEHSLRNLMFTALGQDANPFAIRYPRGYGKNPDWQNDMKALPLGKGECLRRGTDLAVLSLGPIASEALKAAEKAEPQGISVACYDMIFLKPMDGELLGEVAGLQCPIITVEDGVTTGGLGTAVTEWLNARGLDRRVYKIGIPDEFVSQGSVAQLYHWCGMDAEAIYNTIISAKKTV